MLIVTEVKGGRCMEMGGELEGGCRNRPLMQCERRYHLWGGG